MADDSLSVANASLSPVRLRLLGPFVLFASGPVSITSRRARGLLAYLALAPDKAATRERLCGLFWSDRGEQQARASLRQCLFELRKILSEAGLDILVIERDRVGLQAGRIRTDLDDLRDAFGENNDRLILDVLGSVGRGQPLEGLDLRGLYQDWLEQVRAGVEQTIARRVHDSLSRLEVGGRWEEMRSLADAYLQRDPLDEAAVAAAIRADDASGAPASARRRYETLKSALSRELGVAPSAVVEQAMTRLGASEPAAHEPAVGAGGRAMAKEAAQHAAPAGERRHLTILSCGLANVAELTAYLDPEHWHAIAVGFEERIAAAVAPLGGRVGKILPDGLLVYFGYPQAREDAAECAVHAGLAILEVMPEFNGRLVWELPRPLRVQIGVHCGTVVVTRSESGDLDAFGEAPNVAQAARTAAAPDTLAISATVHELVSGRFIVEELGSLAVKGEEGAVRLFRVVRFGLTGGRLFSPRVDAPFFGREVELGLLESRWRRVRGGEGQLVMVTGEAGIGKSRLIDEFRASILSEPHLWIDCAGAPLSANTPFHPVMRLLTQGLGWRGEATHQARLRRLEEALVPTGLDLTEALPLVAELLGLPAPEQYASIQLAPDERRARLLSVLARWVMTVSAAQPLVLVVEDLQWVDASTLELLRILAVQGAAAPLLLLCNARPEFQQVWPVRAHHAAINLGRLAEAEVRSLVCALAGPDALPGEDVERVVARTDGVPLFAEALTRLIIENGAGEGDREVPSTLLDSLTTRLDRLGPAKAVAQAAAVIGRDFGHEILAATCALDEDELCRHLATLEEAELIVARGGPPAAIYRFRHALIQDAAYSALLMSRRRELHHRVARALEERFADFADAQPEVLARHWAAAGEAERAVAAWRSAGEGAYGRRAFPEAESAYREALAVLSATGRTPAREALELELASELDRVLQLTRGYAAPERIAAAEHARVLAKRTGTREQLIREEARIWRGVVTSGDYAAAAALAERIYEMGAADAENPARMIFACNARIQTCFYTGDLRGVEENFAKVSPLIESAGKRQAPGNNNITLGVACLTAWALGRMDLAEERAARAAAFAERSQNPYDMAMRLHFEGVLSGCEGEVDRAKAVGLALKNLADRQGFDYAGALGRATLGWALANDGEANKGVMLLRESVSRLTASGARVGATLILGLLAESEALAGDADAAQMAFTDALTSNPQEHVFRPDILRRRGEQHLLAGETAAAEADFREAIDLARDMQAKALEARAALQLSRLLLSCGEPAPARALVEPFVDAGLLAGAALASAKAVLRDA